MSYTMPPYDGPFPQFDFEIRKVDERDLGKRDKDHRLAFTTIHGPHQATTNVEFLGEDELWTVWARLGLYLAVLK